MPRRVRYSAVFSRMTTTLLLIMVASQLLAGPVMADYTAKITPSDVIIHISGDFMQGHSVSSQSGNGNNTFSAFGRIPVFKNETVTPKFVDQLNNALHAKASTATASGVTLAAMSNGTYLHYDLGFNLAGVTSPQGDVEKIDMRWRSFAITDDVKLGNVSFNLIMPTYLTSEIASLLELPSSQQQPVQITRSWTWDGQIVQRSNVAELIQTASLLNFTSLNKPLENWKASPDPASQTITYESTTGFNLTFAERFVEVGESGTAYSNALYNLKTVIEAPWNTLASGDDLTVEGSSSWAQWTMLGLIVASVAVIGATMVLERRFRISTSRRPKK